MTMNEEIKEQAETIADLDAKMERNIGEQCLGGLKNRELIAAMAMQGLLSNNEAILGLDISGLARTSVLYADALVIELEKK